MRIEQSKLNKSAVYMIAGGMLVATATICAMGFLSAGQNANVLAAPTDVSGFGFICTESIQTFTAPKAGIYKFEAWGAQGGDYYQYDGGGEWVPWTPGGKGGYVSGEKALASGETVYVYVGCAGQSGYYHYNFDDTYYETGGSGGGGASEIRTSNAVSTPATASNRLLVAGGGGGAAAESDFGSDSPCVINGSGGFGGGGGGKGWDFCDGAENAEENNGGNGTATAGGNGGSGLGDGGGGGGASVMGGGGGGNGDLSTISSPANGGRGGYGGPTSGVIQFGLGGVNSDGEGGAGGGGGGWIGGGGGGDNVTDFSITTPRGFDGSASGGGAAGGPNVDFPECNGQGGGDARGGAGAAPDDSEPAGAGGWNGGGGGGSCEGGAGGGGGGYYGGGGGGGYAGAGGGGSSYVSSTLSNARIINGNALMSDPDGSSVTGHSGDGYVKISYVITPPVVGTADSSKLNSTIMAAAATFVLVLLGATWVFVTKKI